MTVLEVSAGSTGRLLWREPIRPGARVDLHYTNSISHAATTEHFAIEGLALRLVEVSSAEEAVLEYLGLPPPYEARQGRLAAKGQGTAFRELTIRIGQTGRQRLSAEGRAIPLYRVGIGESVRVQVTRRPRVLLITREPGPL